jgi:mitochondrial fission protein ELM1
MTRERLEIWLLSDGLPGHANQSVGIVRALATDREVRVSRIATSLRSKALRSAARFLANRAPALRVHLAGPFYRLTGVPDTRPDLIVSAGGNTLAANLALARRHGCPNVFSGTLKGYDPGLFDLVITVTPTTDAPNNLVLDLPPTDITPGTPRTTRSGLLTALIGAPGAGYAYTPDEWSMLAEQMNLISAATGNRWLVTTSRRTGKEIEQLLERGLDPAHVAEAVWYARRPAKVVSRFLAEADVVFVTEDSLSMVAEAIYSARPVVTLQPRIMHPVANDAAALAKYARLGFIQRMAIPDLAGLEIGTLRPPDLPDIAGQIRRAVLGLLQ